MAVWAAGGPPLTPDGGQARGWARQELSRPAYAAAKPTPLDRLARAVQDIVQRLFTGHASTAWAAWLAVAVAVALVVVIVTAVVASGRRGRGRRRVAPARELFGDEESRTAAQLRRAAEAAAAAADWGAAVVLRFRALARGLAERSVVDLPPGATVHAFARSATRALPSWGSRLEEAAAAFDDVRYLRRPGSAAQYAAVAAVDDAARVVGRAATAEPAR